MGPHERGRNLTADRTQAAIAKVGPGPIAQALSQKNPWQALKACASKPSCMFRWIQADELQSHVDKQFGTQVPKAKSKKARPVRHSISRNAFLQKQQAQILVLLRGQTTKALKRSEVRRKSTLEVQSPIQQIA